MQTISKSEILLILGYLREAQTDAAALTLPKLGGGVDGAIQNYIEWRIGLAIRHLMSACVTGVRVDPITTEEAAP